MQNKILNRYYPIIVFTVIGFFGLLTSTLTKRSVCLFTRIFGLPCPACGMTRSQVALLRLDIVNAFRYHPLFWVPPLICLLALLGKLTNKMITILITLLIAVWMIRMILLFPNQIEPMVFNEQALIPRIINTFRNWLLSS